MTLSIFYPQNSRALNMLGRHCTTKLYPQLCSWYLNTWIGLIHPVIPLAVSPRLLLPAPLPENLGFSQCSWWEPVGSNTLKGVFQSLHTTVSGCTNLLPLSAHSFFPPRVSLESIPPWNVHVRENRRKQEKVFASYSSNMGLVATIQKELKDLTTRVL